MRIESFDHVAVRVADRDALAGFLTTRLGVHVIERTERFTLVGADARRGKLTLFDGEGERQQGALLRVGLRVSDLGDALSRLAADVERSGWSAAFTAPDGLPLALVEGPAEVDYDLDHVAVRVRDPAEARETLAGLGFELEGDRLTAGGVALQLVEGDPEDGGRPLLDHLGLRVESAEEHLTEAQERGLEIADVVDGPNTLAVFILGPDGIKLEYVEHKASFSLV